MLENSLAKNLYNTTFLSEYHYNGNSVTKLEYIAHRTRSDVKSPLHMSFLVLLDVFPGKCFTQYYALPCKSNSSKFKLNGFINIMHIVSYRKSIILKI